MKDPDVKKKLEALEVQGLFMNSQDTRKWLEDDVKRFSTIIREAGLVTAATAK
jgi:tripartite-type tricarboxylate transporter receptor subunit TctC